MDGQPPDFWLPAAKELAKEHFTERYQYLFDELVSFIGPQSGCPGYDSNTLRSKFCAYLLKPVPGRESQTALMFQATQWRPLV